MRISKGQADVGGGVSVERLRAAEGHVDQRGSNRMHDADASSLPHTAEEARSFVTVYVRGVHSFPCIMLLLEAT